MECSKVNKSFKAIGVKGYGKYEDFEDLVPKTAREFLMRREEFLNAADTEIALYEPKKDAGHIEGQFFVGLIVNETPEVIPSQMEYIEESGGYVTTRGNIKEISSLHQRLTKWSEESGYERDTGAFIVETYHPLPNGEEEVEIYWPII
ncbi:effector binding domain-containing protein [Chungangia koreensis]|uniref:Effector binding domain-containing protein n=1 Tax=Chungangia koreensis TaxID=752657 RepID=A0ABV8X1J5_9LACT